VHGTLTGQRFQVEVATFRKDGPYSDGRHPDSVEFSDARHDAQRRDFTINGLFYDPIHGKIIDYVDGRRDLKEGIVRAIGRPADRLREDKLRMLRAIRFAARFGFQLDPNTESAIKDMSSELQVVSPERIATELRKMLSHENRVWAIDKLWETGLWQTSFGADGPGSSSSQNRELASILGHLNSLDFALALAAAFAAGANIDTLQNDETESRIAAIKQRLKLSNQEASNLQFFLRAMPTLMCARQLPWSQLQPTLADTRCEQALELARALAIIRETDQDAIEYVSGKLQLPIETLNPIPLLFGQDLIDIGLKPGPKFAQILATARNEQLDGKLADRTDALRWLRDHAGS
jgi:tRNA nucleotidyltransferase/poly(A) polymerase